MLSPLDYLVLYNNVHSKEVKKYIVRPREIKYAVRSMVEVYKPDPTLWAEKIAQVANYDDPAYRCAYLYKYAPLHTCLVQDMFIRALTESAAAINPNFWSDNNCLNICSLGGGPGIDIIGVLSALHRKYGLLRCSAQIIESMPGWKDTFNTILKEFQNNQYGLSGNLTSQYFDFSYIVADLLGKMDSVVNKAIGSASLITMVKFLSAATCIDTAKMIRKIFNSMRHGAVVFIIDNASGGYSELVSRIAEECRMVPVFGPLQYVQYTNPTLNVKKYGSRSCFSTQVTIHLIMKPIASFALEWNPSLKPIIMDYETKRTDYCSSSEDDSAVSFGTSGYDSDYSKIDFKSFDKNSSLSKVNFVHKRQDKLNFTPNISKDSSSEKISMAPGSNIFPPNKFVFEEDGFTENFQHRLKVSEDLDIRSLFKDLDCEPVVLGQISSLTDKPSDFVRKEFDTRFNYPLYELFPQNKVSNDEEKCNDFNHLLAAAVDGLEAENCQKFAASISQTDFEKRVLSGKTYSIGSIPRNDDAEAKAIPSKSHNTLKDDKEIERECIHCSKLKKIKWLQKMCKFCNK